MAGLPPAEIQYMMEHKDDTQQPNVLATCAICLVLPFIAVGLRIYCRKMMREILRADDWLIIAALVPLVGMQASGMTGVAFGFGKHIIFASNPVGFAQAQIANIGCYSLTVLITKLSILHFYHRIIPTRAMTIASYILGTITVLYSLSLLFLMFALCIPLKKFWTPTLPGSCINPTPAFLTLAIVNLVTDVAILVMPIKGVWNLQMSTSRKWQVTGVFALGGVVCVFGAIRAAGVETASDIDVTWTNVQGGIWSSAEVAVGIICACLPTMAPLVSKSARRSRRPQYTNSDYSRGTVNSQHNDKVQLSNRSQDGHAWSNISREESFIQDKESFYTRSRPLVGQIRVNNEVSVQQKDY